MTSSARAGGEDNFHGNLLGLGSQLQYKGMPLLIYIRSQAKNTNTNIAKVYFWKKKPYGKWNTSFPHILNGMQIPA